jgi:hypothetical protein
MSITSRQVACTSLMEAVTRWVPVLSQAEKPLSPINSQIPRPRVSGLACVLHKNTLVPPVLCFQPLKNYRNATYVKARAALERSADFLVRGPFFFIAQRRSTQFAQLVRISDIDF